MCEEVAGPLSLVLLEASGNLLSDTGGQVWVGLGGQPLASLGGRWGEQQTQNVRPLVPTHTENTLQC